MLSSKKDPEMESLLPSTASKEKSPQVVKKPEAVVPSRADTETKDEPAKKKVVSVLNSEVPTLKEVHGNTW